MFRNAAMQVAIKHIFRLLQVFPPDIKNKLTWSQKRNSNSSELDLTLGISSNILTNLTDENTHILNIYIYFYEKKITTIIKYIFYKSSFYFQYSFYHLTFVM